MKCQVNSILKLAHNDNTLVFATSKGIRIGKVAVQNDLVTIQLKQDTLLASVNVTSIVEVKPGTLAVSEHFQNYYLLDIKRW